MYEGNLWGRERGGRIMSEGGSVAYPTSSGKRGRETSESLEQKGIIWRKNEWGGKRSVWEGMKASLELFNSPRSRKRSGRGKGAAGGTRE